MKTRFYKIYNNKDEVVYVGVTTRTISQRFREHIKSKQLDPLNYYCKEFFSIDNGVISSIEEYHQEYLKVMKLEQQFIQEEKDKSSRILNISIGGEWGSTILHRLIKKDFFQKYGTYDGFEKYFKRINKVKTLLRNWIQHRSENKTNKLLRNWLLCKTRNKTNKLLRDWIYNRTQSKTKKLLIDWIYCRVQNKTRALISRWIQHRSEKNKTKELIRNWIYHQSRNKTKNLIGSWIQCRSRNKTKVLINNWIACRTRNTTKNFNK